MAVRTRSWNYKIGKNQPAQTSRTNRGPGGLPGLVACLSHYLETAYAFHNVWICFYYHGSTASGCMGASACRGWGKRPGRGLKQRSKSSGTRNE